MADPAAFTGSVEQQRWLFRRAYLELERRIDLFTRLRIDALDRLILPADPPRCHRQDAGPVGRRRMTGATEVARVPRARMAKRLEVLELEVATMITRYGP